MTGLLFGVLALIGGLSDDDRVHTGDINGKAAFSSEPTNGITTQLPPVSSVEQDITHRYPTSAFEADVMGVSIESIVSEKAERRLSMERKSRRLQGALRTGGPSLATSVAFKEEIVLAPTLRKSGVYQIR